MEEVFKKALIFVELNKKKLSNKEIAELCKTGEPMVSDYLKVIREMNKKKVHLTAKNFYFYFKKMRQKDLLFCSCFK
ncbi:hypothetical protein HY636_01650 [Candidatus Woesearchaeota archaeon]|nr:hypothetical protein [Candidatus Woesearchaeota archaeon]